MYFEGAKLLNYFTTNLNGLDSGNAFNFFFLVCQGQNSWRSLKASKDNKDNTKTSKNYQRAPTHFWRFLDIIYQKARKQLLVDSSLKSTWCLCLSNLFTYSCMSSHTILLNTITCMFIIIVISPLCAMGHLRPLNLQINSANMLLHCINSYNVNKAAEKANN